MAKRETDQPVTAVAVPTPAGPLARPSYIKEGDTRGQETIGVEDIRPPALKLAQSTSPEVKRANTKYIEGLLEGNFFNSLDKEIYGEDPFHILIVKPLGHRHVEFDKDLKVVDFNVPDGDPRTEWRDVIEEGKKIRKKPVATKFYDYLILQLLPDGRQTLMTMSLKSTQLKKATELNSIIKKAKIPSWSYRFKVSPVAEHGKELQWWGWRIVVDGWPSEAEYALAESIYEQFRGKIVTPETEEGDGTPADAPDADIPF